MSILDQYFGTYGMPALQQWQGEDAIYISLGKEELPCKVIPGVERILKKLTVDGTTKIQSREFTFTKAEVVPEIHAVVKRADGEQWPIVEHVSENDVYCCVRCERELINERTREGFRGAR